MITIIYDAQAVSNENADALTKSLQQIISNVMATEDVFFVYTNAPQKSAAIEPIEIFVQVNKAKVADPAKLTEDISAQLAVWKQQNDFKLPVNINVIPVEWHFKIGV